MIVDALRFQGGQVRVIRVREIWVDRIGPRRTCCRDLPGSYRKQGGGYGRHEKGFKEPRGIRAWGNVGAGNSRGQGDIKGDRKRLERM